MTTPRLYRSTLLDSQGDQAPIGLNPILRQSLGLDFGRADKTIEDSADVSNVEQDPRLEVVLMESNNRVRTTDIGCVSQLPNVSVTSSYGLLREMVLKQPGIEVR